VFKRMCMKPLSKAGMARLLIIPTLVVLLAFFFWPLLRIAGMSLHFPQLSLAEYATILNPVNRVIVFKTFTIAGGITLLTLLLAYPMAAFLCQIQGTWKKVAMLCVLLPFLTSFLVRSYAWMVLLGDEGAINTVLRWLGIIDFMPIELLYNRIGMTVGMVHIMLPLAILPIYAAMRAIDPMQWKAAQALGSGFVRSFLTVYLPQTYTGIRSACTLVFILSLGFYITPAMLGSARDLMLGNLIAINVEVGTSYEFSAAAAWILLLGTLTIFVLLRQRPPRAKSTAIQRFCMYTLRLDTLALALSRRRWAQTRHWMRAKWFKAHVLLNGFGVLLCLYLILPSVIVIIASFNGQDSLAFPPEQWSLRWYEFLFTDPQWAEAGWWSLRVALFSSALTMVLGTLAAWGIAKLRGTVFSQIGYGAALAPLVVPTVVTALGVFIVLAEWGLYGSLIGVVIMHACLSIPLVAVLLVAAFQNFDERLEMAAHSLGASRWRSFRSVVAPLTAPSMLSALLIAFLHSFDELILTSFISGTFVITVPLKMWENIRNQIDPVIAALSAVLILIACVALLLQSLLYQRNSRVRPVSVT